MALSTVPTSQINLRFTACARIVAVAAIAAGCATSEAPALPPDTFAFGVFGDGPYRSWELGQFKRVVQDANRTDLQWFLHVGDLLWHPCSDHALADRLQTINAIRHPVIYTPGDNEWADCHEEIAGKFQPLERLQRLRSTYFAQPRNSLGRRIMRLESQSESPAWKEFVENARWSFGGFVFVTIHMVGSSNATDSFPGRTAADDAEVVRRTEAALDWLDAAFVTAEADSLSGVIVAIHGDPGLERAPAVRDGYASFVDALERHVRAFSGQVLLIHGDSHTFGVDHPLKRSDTGEVLRNFTRLVTFGSPDIGWVRVVVDSVAGRVVEFEPRPMPRGLSW
ncbi:MAG: hypothetical protein ABR543_16210 [Gemmatimonadaceae bacterium]